MIQPWNADGDWQEIVDPQGKVYYTNLRTGLTKWEPPTAAVVENCSPACPSTDFPLSVDIPDEKLSSTDDWQEITDPHGKVYYYNNRLGVTSWTKGKTGQSEYKTPALSPSSMFPASSVRPSTPFCRTTTITSSSPSFASSTSPPSAEGVFAFSPTQSASFASSSVTNTNTTMLTASFSVSNTQPTSITSTSIITPTKTTTTPSTVTTTTAATTTATTTATSTSTSHESSSSVFSFSCPSPSRPGPSGSNVSQFPLSPSRPPLPRTPGTPSMPPSSSNGSFSSLMASFIGTRVPPSPSSPNLVRVPSTPRIGTLTTTTPSTSNVVISPTRATVNSSSIGPTTTTATTTTAATTIATTIATTATTATTTITTINTTSTPVHTALPTSHRIVTPLIPTITAPSQFRQATSPRAPPEPTRGSTEQKTSASSFIASAIARFESPRPSSFSTASSSGSKPLSPQALFGSNRSASTSSVLPRSPASSRGSSPSAGSSTTRGSGQASCTSTDRSPSPSGFAAVIAAARARTASANARSSTLNTSSSHHSPLKPVSPSFSNSVASSCPLPPLELPGPTLTRPESPPPSRFTGLASAGIRPGSPQLPPHPSSPILHPSYVHTSALQSSPLPASPPMRPPALDLPSPSDPIPNGLSPRRRQSSLPSVPRLSPSHARAETLPNLQMDAEDHKLGDRRSKVLAETNQFLYGQNNSPPALRDPHALDRSKILTQAQEHLGRFSSPRGVK